MDLVRNQEFIGQVGNEIEIIFFQKREKNFLIKENDFDSQLIIELKRVQGNLVNTRGHYSFEEQL